MHSARPRTSGLLISFEIETYDLIKDNGGIKTFKMSSFVIRSALDIPLALFALMLTPYDGKIFLRHRIL